MGARFHVVALAPDRDAEPVRTFQSFTQELHRLADWLETVGISTVAMDPGRKTDVNDAQWLQQLHQFGLLRASFRPQQKVVTLRAYLRQRDWLLDYAVAHIQHMRKALVE